MSDDLRASHGASDAEWERWGRQDPYRGVLGIDSLNISEEQKATFLASGVTHINQVLNVAEQYFGAPNWNGRALDFGCGVGRLLVPLRDRFESVVGVDISVSMLQVARENLGEDGNVTLICGLENLPSAILNADDGFDFVHTFIVLQHIRPKQGMLLFARLLDLVRPGGLFAIHVTVGDQLRKRRILNQIRYNFRPAHWAYNLLRARPLNEPKTEMGKYDTGAIFDLLRERQCEPVLAYSLDHNRHVGVMFIGRKNENSAKPLRVSAL